jgi:hypothetical protein
MMKDAPNPPGWAESLFVALLPIDRSECESGDLLEAYRDQQVPFRGRAAADWWYVRQVIAVFARSYGFWLAALVSLFVAGDLANTYRLVPHAAATPLALFFLILVASAHGGWRTGRTTGGMFAGVALSGLLWLSMATWWMATWYLFIPAQQADPFWIHAWHFSEAPGETFAHWIFWDNIGATIMSGLALGAGGSAIGLAGGLTGATARRVRRVPTR